MGNVNGWRGWAIGHGEAESPPLSRQYLANHLSAVMGPVQLSELSQELKPAPARGPDWETVRGRLGFSRQSREGERVFHCWPGWGPQGPGPGDPQGHHRSTAVLSLLSGKMLGFGGARCGYIE